MSKYDNRNFNVAKNIKYRLFQLASKPICWFVEYTLVIYDATIFQLMSYSQEYCILR